MLAYLAAVGLQDVLIISFVFREWKAEHLHLHPRGEMTGERSLDQHCQTNIGLSLCNVWMISQKNQQCFFGSKGLSTLIRMIKVLLKFLEVDAKLKYEYVLNLIIS